MRLTWIFVGLGFIFGLAHARSAPPERYRIEINIANLPHDTLYLGFYYKGRTYISDTAYRTQKEAPFVFSRNERLSQGFYYALNRHNNLLLEFVIGEVQDMVLQTQHPEYVTNMQVEGDKENRLFFRFLQENKKNYQRAAPHIAILNDSTQNESAHKKAQAHLERINTEAEAFVDQIAQENPNAIVAKLIRLQKKIEIPEPKAGEAIDSTFQFQYYRDHYFDNFDLGDPIALRFSKNYFKEKVEDYLDNLHLPEVGVIIEAIERMSAQARPHKENLQYLIWLCTLKYQRYPIMGMDSVFVYLYDQYYANGIMDDFGGRGLVNSVQKLSDQMRLSLIGKKGPNMVMLDQHLIPRSLYGLRNKYLLLYFFDPDCGSCEKETPVLVKTQRESEFDIGIFAVCADTSMQKMRDYIQKMDLGDWTVVNGPRTYTGNYQNLYDARATPTTFILDREFNIIAKKLPADKIDLFLRRYEYLQKARKKQGKL